MAQFLDLPVDLLPLILSHIFRPHQIALACLVNNDFRHFATPQLYDRVTIYSWQKEAKTKVIIPVSNGRSAYSNNTASPRSSKYLQLSPDAPKLPCSSIALVACFSYLNRLACQDTSPEIRDFPKAFSGEIAGLMDTVIDGLRNCVNLRACTWTRDGSLHSGILSALQSSKELKGLEINGHSDGNYDPRLLMKFTHLNSISIIMPSASVVGQLHSWMQLTGGTLRSLTLICKTSILVTDELLDSLAVELQSLSHFYITGCPRVTHKGIWSILSANNGRIEGLGLEGVSPRFGLGELALKCSSSGVLSRLKSITLTVNQQIPLDVWMCDVLDLLSRSPLEIFRVYSTGAVLEAKSTDQFWAKLISCHRQRLTRFSVHRMLISLSSIKEICTSCPSLEEIFVVVEQGALHKLGACMSPAKLLRVIHINYPLEAKTNAPPVLSPSEALAVVRQCSPTLTQFGCNAKVWKVMRTTYIDKDGVVQSDLGLSRYDNPDIPEAFLIVRT